jgi:hypothetical protein
MRLAALVLALLPSLAARADDCAGAPAGSCWLVEAVAVTASTTGASAGRSVRCTLRCRAPSGGTLLLRDDGTYTSPASAAALGCASRPVPLPDEEGTIHRRRKRLVLEPGNLGALESLLEGCAARDVALTRYRTTVRVAPDGTALAGRTTIRVDAPGRPRLVTRLVGRFTAVPAAAAPAARTSSHAYVRVLPACSEDVRPRCVSD